MFRILALALFMVWSTSLSWCQWQHKLLADGVPGIIGGTYFVNRRGDATFTTGEFNVHRNLEILGNGVGLGMNASGQVTYRNANVWVDRTNVSAGLLPPTYQGLFTRGPTADGRPFWSVQANGNDEIYLGREALGLASLIPGPIRACGPVAVNSSGQMVWNAANNPSGERWVFKDKTNISDAVLGRNGLGVARGINDAGQVLWWGHKANSVFVKHVYRDDFDITQAAFGNATVSGIARSMNASGHVSWEGFGAIATHGHSEVILDTTRLSFQIYGLTSLYVQAFFPLSDTGYLNWDGADDSGWDTFVNLRNVSRETLGDNRLWAQGRGVDDFGRALWASTLWDDPLMHRHVFMDTFDLSADVYGTEIPDSVAMAVGPNGHALWAANLGNNNWQVWLSTPVPEPSSYLLLALFPFVAARRDGNRR